AGSTHSRRSERRLPDRGRGRLPDSVSRARIHGRPHVLVGDGSAAERRRRRGVPARLLRARTVAGVVPAVRGERRHARARDAVGGLVPSVAGLKSRATSERSANSPNVARHFSVAAIYFSSSLRSIGCSPIRTHCTGPYLAKSWIFASTNCGLP